MAAGDAVSAGTVAGDPVALLAYTEAVLPTLDLVDASYRALLAAHAAYLAAPSSLTLRIGLTEADVRRRVPGLLVRLGEADRRPAVVGLALGALDVVDTAGVAPCGVLPMGEVTDGVVRANDAVVDLGVWSRHLASAERLGIDPAGLLGLGLAGAGGATGAAAGAGGARAGLGTRTGGTGRGVAGPPVPSVASRSAAAWGRLSRGAGVVGFATAGVGEWREVARDEMATPGERAAAAIGATLVEGSLAAVGGTVGVVAGQIAVPIPVAGAAVGAVAGAYVGAEAGAALRSTAPVRGAERSLAGAIDRAAGTTRERPRYDRLVVRSRGEPA